MYDKFIKKTKFQFSQTRPVLGPALLIEIRKILSSKHQMPKA